MLRFGPSDPGGAENEKSKIRRCWFNKMKQGEFLANCQNHSKSKSCWIRIPLKLEIFANFLRKKKKPLVVGLSRSFGSSRGGEIVVDFRKWHGGILYVVWNVFFPVSWSFRCSMFVPWYGWLRTTCCMAWTETGEPKTARGTGSNEACWLVGSRRSDCYISVSVWGCVVW